MTRLIDADALHTLFDEKCASECAICTFYENCKENLYCGLIDLAPTVEERPQGEWFDCLPKNLLKARHGDYVVYKVDYLLDNLTREVFNMEGARRMKPVKEDDND